jgi:hypothetical protein
MAPTVPALPLINVGLLKLSVGAIHWADVLMLNKISKSIIAINALDMSAIGFGFEQREKTFVAGYWVEFVLIGYVLNFTLLIT